MSIRFDNPADKLTYTSPFNFNAAYTWMGWFYRSGAGAGDYQPVMVIDDGSSANSEYFTFYVPTSTWGCYVSIGGPFYGGEYGTSAISTWYHVAMVRESTTSLKFYVDGSLIHTITNNVGARASATVMTVANWSGSEDLNGRVAYMKAFLSALTQAQVQQERETIRAHYGSPWGWWPCFPGTTERDNDYSGNGRDWTQNGTLVDESPPPVSWGAPGVVIPRRLEVPTGILGERGAGRGILRGAYRGV